VPASALSGGISRALLALAPDSSNVMQFVVSGGSGTVTHTADIYSQDEDGLWQLYGANDPVWHGGRVDLVGAAGTEVATTYSTQSGGAAISPQPLLRYQDGATNKQKYSNDLTNAEWTATNVTVAQNETGLDGTSNSACTLTATAANGTVIGNAITNAAAENVAYWFIKRKTGTGVVELTVDNGATWVAITSQISADFDYCYIQQNQANPQMGIRIVTSGDAVIVGNAQLHTNVNDDYILGQGPIFTTSAAVSVDDTVYDLPDAITNECAVYFEFVKFQTGAITGHMVAAGEGTTDYHFRPQGSTTLCRGAYVNTSDASVTLTVAGTAVAIGAVAKGGIACSASEGKYNIYVHDTWGTESSVFKSLKPSGSPALAIGNSTRTAANFLIGQFEVWTGGSAYSDYTAKVEELAS
jgi:hypothetical protein